jgi:hypothetical protein
LILVRNAAAAAGLDRAEGDARVAKALANVGLAPLTAAVNRFPRDARVFAGRGEWLARRRRWKEAANDYAEAARLRPDRYLALKAAALLAEVGDAERHARLCRALMERWAATDDPAVADKVAKACLLLPAPAGDKGQLADLDERAVAADKRHGSGAPVPAVAAQAPSSFLAAAREALASSALPERRSASDSTA